ncbi:MAG: hypothetical protein ACO1NV_18090 [Leptospira bouyouniensis]|uniref:Lipoprotein n=1 Tax=Leptospira bouyouniensis TaxID=2484911 RepID=A0A7I0HMT9_9LEPT|nr:hypothetical protein [Leptospira bouyouniensis]TGL03065.1 hypothetical protein EHQ43_14775 [Leptospira bouyouniensis]TGM79996.1 hypothetical protein EHQ99_09760 [Leptospira bouyouniensis]
MKFFLFVVILFSVSCSLFRETVGYQKFSIPSGKTILLVPTVSSFYSDQHTHEKEIVLQITEELERYGFLVIQRDTLHEFKTFPVLKDHLVQFESNLSPTSGLNESKLTYWYGIASGLDIPIVVFIRFPHLEKTNVIFVRLMWTHLQKKQTERFDWEWKFNSPLPFLRLMEGDL